MSVVAAYCDQQRAETKALATARSEAGVFHRVVVTYDGEADYPFVVRRLPGPQAPPERLLGLPVVFDATAAMSRPEQLDLLGAAT